MALKIDSPKTEKNRSITGARVSRIAQTKVWTPLH